MTFDLETSGWALAQLFENRRNPGLQDGFAPEVSPQSENQAYDLQYALHQQKITAIMFSAEFINDPPVIRKITDEFVNKVVAMTFDMHNRGRLKSENLPSGVTDSPTETPISLRRLRPKINRQVSG